MRRILHEQEYFREGWRPPLISEADHDQIPHQHVETNYQSGDSDFEESEPIYWVPKKLRTLLEIGQIGETQLVKKFRYNEDRKETIFQFQRHPDMTDYPIRLNKLQGNSDILENDPSLKEIENHRQKWFTHKSRPLRTFCTEIHSDQYHHKIGIASYIKHVERTQAQKARFLGKKKAGNLDDDERVLIQAERGYIEDMDILNGVF